jgi:membrane-associated phospholipid phosphatase
MKPCIYNVRGDLSYPSGHATFAYVMAYLLRDMRSGKMWNGEAPH